tara:strand:+ start:3496 stop:3744 length:249 start_codon:yes stop_codon:yes gene_type:complete
MSKELDNKKIESVKRGLTLIGETTALEDIENLERILSIYSKSEESRILLCRLSVAVAWDYGIKIARSTGEIMNESELGGEEE